MNLPRERASKAGGREVAPGLFHRAGLPIERMPPHGIIAVAIVRDEGWRLPFWLAYHRWLGVDRFIIIDNTSADQTADILAEQPDVTLVSAPGRFQFPAWPNQIIRLCPPESWTLAIDADELFVCPPWRLGGLRSAITALEQESADIVYALMVDCHGERLSAPAAGASAIPWQRAPWFDAGPYAIWRSGSISQLHAGARERLCWPGWKYWRHVPDGALRFLIGLAAYPFGLLVPPCIVKTPLHRARARGRGVHRAGAGQRATSHFSVLHYKLDIDLPQKVKTALAERQHWRGSAEYRVYAKYLQDPSSDLRTAASRRFTGLASLTDAQVCYLDPTFVSRVGESGPIDTTLAEVEAEVSRFGDRHFVPTIPLAVLG